MKNIFSGTFEQVEDKVSKEFAKNVYIEFGNVKFLAVIPLVLFLLGEAFMESTGSAGT